MIRAMMLTLEQYDICWADLSLGEHVYPLQIRSHGRTHEERAHVRRRVYEQLTSDGISRGRRLDPELQDALTLLSRATVWVDMQWLSTTGLSTTGLSTPEQTGMDRAVGARSGERGLVARLDAKCLQLTPCRGTSMLRMLMEQLPPSGAASGKSITMPRDGLVPSRSGPAESVYDTSPASGRFRQEYLALEDVLSKPRTRGGQIVANTHHATGKRRRSRPVQWFDTDAGRWTTRMLPAQDGAEHLTVSPADRTLMVTQVAELIESIVR